MLIQRSINQPVDGEWVTFKGGELEGKRPKALCPACRKQLGHMAREPRAPSHEARATSPEPRPICDPAPARPQTSES